MRYERWLLNLEYEDLIGSGLTTEVEDRLLHLNARELTGERSRKWYQIVSVDDSGEMRLSV
jgi:hypothetical protein